MCASAFAARAPLRKVGPRFTVMLENLGAEIFLTAQISFVLAVSKTIGRCDGGISEIRDLSLFSNSHSGKEYHGQAGSTTFAVS